MVVFPAPSSPRIRILISRVPNKLEKMVEKKPPAKKQNRKAFQCQLAIRKGRQINLISYWATRCFFSPVKTDKFRLSPRHLCWTALYFHGFMLVFYGSSVQPNHVAAASSFLIVVRIFFFLFSHFPKSKPTSFLFVIGLSFQSKRLYKGTLKPEITLSDVYDLPPTGPPTYFLLKMKYKSVGAC